MKFKLLILTATTLLLASSCSNVFIPALYHQDIAYQPKPTSFDKSKTVAYVSAGLNHYTNCTGYDMLNSGQVNISVGHVFNHFNIAYGSFGIIGDYSSEGSKHFNPNPFDSKFFGAVGGRFSANYFITSDNMDFRFVGMEAAYSHEFGDYANYRQEIFRKGYLEVDPRTNLYTIGLTSEAIFHSKNNAGLTHAIRGFLGTTINNKKQNDFYYKHQLGLDNLHDLLFPKVSYFVTFKKYFFTAEAGENIFIRFGYKF